MPVSDYVSGSFVGRDDLVHAIMRRLLAVQPPTRKLLIDGPANRGKSWLLCRLHEQLNDRTTLAALAPSAGAVCATLFTQADNVPFLPGSDPVAGLRLIARLWYDLHLHQLLPTLLVDYGLPAQLDQAQTISALADLFTRRGAGVQDLIVQTTDRLGASRAVTRLVLLIDGLDEFVDLERFEKQFVRPLFGSPLVQVVATRRAEVQGARWMASELRSREDELLSLAALSRQAAIQQINQHLHGSRLTFADLAALFKHYAWQNPGANRHFAEEALKREQQGCTPLIDQTVIRSCIRNLSCSEEPSVVISDTDLAWLIAVVKAHPLIGQQEVPVLDIKPTLVKVSGEQISDYTRNEWLGRLQDRGIAVRRRNTGHARVHEEFAALCLEL